MRKLSLLIIPFLFSGCEVDRVARLEKENKELRTELEKKKHVDLDTQDKCAKAAKQFVNDEYELDRSTITLHHNSHYNPELGKCFVLVEWHYKDQNSARGSWFNLIKLTDAYQRDEYAEFSEYTDILLNFKSEKRVYSCWVAKNKCKDIEEFSQLTQHFMQ